MKLEDCDLGLMAPQQSLPELTTLEEAKDLRAVFPKENPHGDHFVFLVITTSFYRRSSG
jgi:hypothetical protein